MISIFIFMLYSIYRLICGFLNIELLKIEFRFYLKCSKINFGGVFGWQFFNNQTLKGVFSRLN